MRDNIRKVFKAMQHSPRFPLKDVDLTFNTATGDGGAIRRDGDGIQGAFDAVADRWSQDSAELQSWKLPDPHGLILADRRKISILVIDTESQNGASMPTGLNAKQGRGGLLGGGRRLCGARIHTESSLHDKARHPSRNGHGDVAAPSPARPVPGGVPKHGNHLLNIKCND